MAGRMTNEYSSKWFELFMANLSPAQTHREVEFLRDHLPRPQYTTVIDLCCGTGRHAQALALHGYHVIGVDRDRAALAQARQLSPDVNFVEADMRSLGNLSVQADALVCLWQSFGYFDDATNITILEQISQLLPARGRFILDVYHRLFFESHQGTDIRDVAGEEVTETRRVRHGRLVVELTYRSTDITDRFDWRTYTPEEIASMARPYGLRPIVACTGYNAGTPSTHEAPRMQLVFEKAAGHS